MIINQEKYCDFCYQKIVRVYYEMSDNIGNSTGKIACPSSAYKAKAMSDLRIGDLDPRSTHGKGFIGQQIVAQTYNVEDCNLKFDNFNFYIDLSNISGYGNGEIKTMTFNKKRDRWHFSGIYRWFASDENKGISKKSTICW